MVNSQKTLTYNNAPLPLACYGSFEILNVKFVGQYLAEYFGEFHLDLEPGLRAGAVGGGAGGFDP
jgi:hypothetical protein